MPELLTVEEVARLLGVCKRVVLSNYIRDGLLPWPDASGRFKRADVQALIARFESERAARKK